uniref:Myosin XVIIIB n=1 Tax=Phasianus colchicus TaxID=9054 RepID=A0A669PEQ3_PHACC
MAISSRLALWEQKGSIREEDRGPPPSAPPLLLSVIPGGFIKQLVRETEKESKEARLKKAAKASGKEEVSSHRTAAFSFSWQPVVEDSPAQSRDSPAAKGTVSSVGKSLQNGLQAGGQGGKGTPTHTALPPGTAAPSSDPSKAPTVAQSPRPEGPQAVKPQSPEKKKGEKSSKTACPGGSPLSAAPATSKGPQHCGKVKEGDVPKGKGPEGTKKEKGAALSGQQPPSTASTKRELGLGRKEPEKMKKDVGGGKKEPKEMKEPAKSTNKSQGAKREAGGTREKPEGVAKGVGKAKGEPRESKEATQGGEEAVADSKAAHVESKEETGESAAQDAVLVSCSSPALVAVAAGSPCGRGAPSQLPECCSLLLQAPKDAWYEADKVWLVQQDGFVLATQLKPDVGTPELPAGRVRVRRDADGSITEVDEDSVQRTNPPHLDLAEDLAMLLNLNECSALNTLQHRYRSHLPYTYAGPSLVAIRPGPDAGTHVSKGRRDSTAPHICSVTQRAYRTLLAQRRDQAILPMGRSGAGKTTSCQLALEHLVGTAGSVDGQVSVEKIQAMFTVLGAFGAVSTEQNSSSTRFSMILSLDFSAAGRITAAHLQTMLLERGRVAQQPPGESNFNVFPMMLAGLDMAQRTTLHLHQVAESNAFGIKPFSKPEEKQKASAAFAKLQAAMGVLGITAEEQMAMWRVLAGIHHLGAAGACRVGRKQFMHFEWATHAAEVLGCELEELSTAVFKHHLKQILAQAKWGGEEERNAMGAKMTGVECVEGMASGLYEELFAALVSMINRSFSSQHLSIASIAVVDTPGFHNPRHQGGQRAATFEELCHNYVHERLQGLFYERTFVSEMERYKEENVEVSFDLPERSPLATLSIVDLNPSQVLPGSLGADHRGLLWILDEEVLIPGSGDGAAFDRLCSYFGAGCVRKCEQALHFEIPHQLGTDPVRYDLAGWVSKAKLNLSAENASQLLQQSQLNALQELAMLRRGVPRVCRAVAGLEGCSQAALQRNACIRKVFASSLAAVRRRSVCAQLKLQVDALTSLLRRSQLHFVHSLVPGTAVEKADPLLLDVPALRAQLGGTQLLDALRLCRTGYADHLLLTHFRRRFQVLAPAVMKKCTSAYEVPDESKAIEELFQALDLEKKSVAIGRSQVFLKAGVLSRLEKQRDKLIAQKLTLLQAACKGFLSRQKFKRLKVQRLAVRCIQKNVVVFQAVRHWPWWQLLSRVRPLLSINLAEEQLRVKEKELAALRRKLERSEQSCSELRQNTEKLESKIIDLTMELSDERHKGDVACQVLDGERAERLRGTRELQELQSKYDQVQKKLESVQKQLEEAQQLVQLLVGNPAHGKDAWQVRFDCAQTEIAFLQKRLAQLEERLSAELSSRTGLEQKLGEVQAACQAARAAAQQLRRRCRRLTCELEDARVLAESQQSRSHELEKRQKKFDLQLAQALGESAFERSLREKVVQENSSLRWEMGKLQQSLEGASLAQRVSQLAGRVQELSAPSVLDSCSVPMLRQQLWDLEASSAEQRKELERQTANVDHLEQLHQRLELEIERMKQIHQKELEDKDEELEDARQSCQRRLRQLEMQLEQEHEEKQTALREKQDLEGLVGTLCEQIGHRDLDVEKRLRRDLRRTRALLADAQLLLAAPTEPGATGTAELHLEKLDAILDPVLTHTFCPQADEQLSQVQHEKAELLRRVSEDQEDLNELMAKHKALIAQSATDIAQIQELQTQVEEVKKEKQSLQEKLLVAQASVARLEQRPAERAVISRQEARIRDLESQLDFQAVQMKRFEVLVLRLRDSIIKMGEELEKAAESEAREKESTKYYQRRMEEMKADMDELVQRELESSRRRVELEQQLAEAAAARQGLQADLGTAIRRIADLQLALEELRASDDSDAERDACSSAGSVLSLEPTESLCSWPGSSIGWSSPTGGSVAGSISPAATRLGSSLSTTRSVDAAADMGKAVSPLLSTRRREYGKPPSDSVELTSPLDKPAARSPLPSASAALSDYVGELRRRRAVEKEQGPLLEDTTALPIYRTTGAAALRRSRPRLGDAGTELPGLSDGTDGGLPRSSSLRSLAQQPGEPTLSPVLKRASKFGSCDSLLLSLGGPELLGPRPWRSCLEPSAEEDGQAAGWASPGTGLGEGLGGDPCAWKIPTLGFERRASTELEEFLPAIRKSRSTSSLAKPGRDRKDGHRALTVRFQDEAMVGDLASSRSRSVAQPGLTPGKDRSDSSSSSGSILSSRSTDSIKQRPWRSDGEGCSGKGSTESSRESHRAEAEGKEDDVSSIMRKYLGKE